LSAPGVVAGSGPQRQCDNVANKLIDLIRPMVMSRSVEDVLFDSLVPGAEADGILAVPIEISHVVRLSLVSKAFHAVTWQPLIERYAELTISRAGWLPSCERWAVRLRAAEGACAEWLRKAPIDAHWGPLDERALRACITVAATCTDLAGEPNDFQLELRSMDALMLAVVDLDAHLRALATRASMPLDRAAMLALGALCSLSRYLIPHMHEAKETVKWVGAFSLKMSEVEHMTRRSKSGMRPQHFPGTAKLAECNAWIALLRAQGDSDDPIKRERLANKGLYLARSAETIVLARLPEIIALGRQLTEEEHRAFRIERTRACRVLLYVSYLIGNDEIPHDFSHYYDEASAEDSDEEDAPRCSEDIGAAVLPEAPRLLAALRAEGAREGASASDVIALEAFVATLELICLELGAQTGIDC
jgi:hypothetical protein